MTKTMKRRLLIAGAILLLCILTAPFALVYGIYFYYVATMSLPRLGIAPPVQLSRPCLDAAWVEAGGTGKPIWEGCSPLVVARSVGECPPSAETNIAWLAARHLAYDVGLDRRGKLSWHLGGTATSCWVRNNLTYEQTVGLYLSKAYFGYGIIGIEKASQQAFGKGPTLLNLAECALLISVLRSPARYNPCGKS